MRFAVCSMFVFFTFGALAEEYEVLPHSGEGPRGTFWIADGPSYISGGSDAWANRFRLGAGLEMGDDHRFLLGLNIIDSFSKAEKSREVGGVTRSGSGLVLGYDLIPQKLSLAYTLVMHSVRGDRVTGSVSAYGHQLAVTHRLYTGRQFRLSTELSYMIVPDVSVPVFDVPSNSTQNATFPSAQIATLSVVFGFGLN